MRRTRFGAAAVLVGSVVAAAGASSPAQAAPTLPESPAGHVQVLSVNLGEMLSSPDIAERRDVNNFTYRVNSVLGALGEYAPDVVLLQEVNKETAQATADALSSRLGYDYVVGAQAAPGEDAVVAARVGDVSPKVVRSNAIVYNRTTMYTPPAPVYVQLGYALAAAKPGEPWVANQQTILQLTERVGARSYTFASTHYVPSGWLQSPDWYKASWSTHMKDKLDYTNRIPVMGGDLNWRPCATEGLSVGDPACDGNPVGEFTQMWQALTLDAPAYQSARPNGIDHILTGGTVVSSNYDYDYKAYGSATGRFASREDFLACDALYYDGRGGSATAAAIEGCQSRYYSDHAFVWALIH